MALKIKCVIFRITFATMPIRNNVSSFLILVSKTVVHFLSSSVSLSLKIARKESK